MGTGIIVCGLNGSGKSTLGKALADALGFHFIDNEDLYFPKTDPNYMYAVQRTQEEVEKLLMDEVRQYGDFVFAAVKGNYGEDIIPFYKYAVLIEVPREVRLERVRKRSYNKFGDRMLKGGDLYEREKAFFELVGSRSERLAEDWVKTLKCPIIRVDGTKPIEENVEVVVEQIRI